MKMKNQPVTIEKHENRPGTMKNQPGTMKNHKNPPGTMKNYEKRTTITTMSTIAHVIGKSWTEPDLLNHTATTLQYFCNFILHFCNLFNLHWGSTPLAKKTLRDESDHFSSHFSSLTRGPNWPFRCFETQTKYKNVMAVQEWIWMFWKNTFETS